mmetsp:Transcript_18003/g.24318  ORF Transcript_18003/g.24318 Transcript_18003/m.24318 type:complete len:106 (+) Transcript_18003:502-819(+)
MACLLCNSQLPTGCSSFDSTFPLAARTTECISSNLASSGGKLLDSGHLPANVGHIMVLQNLQIAFSWRVCDIISFQGRQTGRERRSEPGLESDELKALSMVQCFP